MPTTMYPPPAKAGSGRYCVYFHVGEDRGQLFFLHNGVFKIRIRLTISRPENPKRVTDKS